MKFRKRPVVIEASRWWKNGDAPCAVSPYCMTSLDQSGICAHCGTEKSSHGWIETLEGGHIVCPGDWIITGVKDECYPCKPDIFAATYETVNNSGQGNPTIEEAKR